jgi:DNA repair protein RecO (recombination protein O)
VPTRNIVYESLVLRARESPGGDRILCLMTAEAGIQDVFVFGGPKSKLRSLASPYSSGRAFVYLDPTRDFRKLSDFEVTESFTGLREGLKKIWAAGLVAEFLLKTSGGGGDFPEVLALARAAMRGLESCREEEADYPLLLFLWRMIELLGLLPEAEHCSVCGLPFPEGAGLLYSFAAGGFLCPDCARSEASGGSEGAGARSGESRGWGSGRSLAEFPNYSLSAGAARWLSRSAALPFAEASRLGLDASSLAGLKALVFGLARSAADAPLASLSVGAGIL